MISRYVKVKLTRRQAERLRLDMKTVACFTPEPANARDCRQIQKRLEDALRYA